MFQSFPVTGAPPLSEALNSLSAVILRVISPEVQSTKKIVSNCTVSPSSHPWPPLFQTHCAPGSLLELYVECQSSGTICYPGGFTITVVIAPEAAKIVCWKVRAQSKAIKAIFLIISNYRNYIFDSLIGRKWKIKHFLNERNILQR